MQIAIASGKGGTGKTTLATNLAYYLSANQIPITLLDCDVEEPNSHIFIKPQWTITEKCYRLTPKVDEEKCQSCGTCGQVCQFSAIVNINNKPLTFPDLCHSCGLCSLQCPAKAIIETPREIGLIEIGDRDNITFVHGKLKVGEAMSPPLIKEVKKHANVEGISIIDAPPGTSCPVIQALAGSDFVILVTEPTPFGLNDLKLAVGMVRALNIPFAVAINKADIGDENVLQYCRENNIPVILQIPHSIKVAQSYSKGNLVMDQLPNIERDFENALSLIKKELGL